MRVVDQRVVVGAIGIAGVGAGPQTVGFQGVLVGTKLGLGIGGSSNLHDNKSLQEQADSKRQHRFGQLWIHVQKIRYTSAAISST